MITIISYPANTLNQSFLTSDTLDSAEIVKNLFVNVAEAIDEQYIEITYNSVVTTLLITDECRFTPIDIYFINKEGAQQSVTFLKKRTDTLNITSEEYESDKGQPQLYNHQFDKYNVNGKVSFDVNTGFVDESQNEIFKQLFLSSKVWVLENNILAPVNVTSKNLQFKTRQNDRLINYNVKFDYAFNEINNI